MKEKSVMEQHRQLDSGYGVEFSLKNVGLPAVFWPARLEELKFTERSSLAYIGLGTSLWPAGG